MIDDKLFVFIKSIQDSLSLSVYNTVLNRWKGAEADDFAFQNFILECTVVHIIVQ